MRPHAAELRFLAHAVDQADDLGQLQVADRPILPVLKGRLLDQPFNLVAAAVAGLIDG